MVDMGPGEHRGRFVEYRGRYVDVPAESIHFSLPDVWNVVVNDLARSHRIGGTDMHVTDEGAVVGSIDRAALAEIEASDEDAKAQLEQLQAEAQAAEDEAAAAAETPEPEPQPEVETGAEAEVKPSMALTKDELVNLAAEAGLGERGDLEQFTKQELLDELNANEGEG